MTRQELHHHAMRYLLPLPFCRTSASCRGTVSQQHSMQIVLKAYGLFWLRCADAMPVEIVQFCWQYNMQRLQNLPELAGGVVSDLTLDANSSRCLHAGMCSRLLSI